MSGQASSRRPKSERSERTTEDEDARAELGGVKGTPELPPAPLTKREREQMPRIDDDPGHVAQMVVAHVHFTRRLIAESGLTAWQQDFASLAPFGDCCNAARRDGSNGVSPEKQISCQFVAADNFIRQNA